MGKVRNKNRASIACAICGDTFTVPRYRAGTAKFCGKVCAGKSQAERYLNNGPKPWAAKNLDGHRHKSTSRFGPGHEPWNKDLKGIHLSPDSEFKPGRESETKLPIGSVTLRTDKQGHPRAWVKTVNGWEMRARIVYEAKNGPIPEGMIIHHDDRDTLNDRPCNLIAMTRAEHIEEHRDDLMEGKRA